MSSTNEPSGAPTPAARSSEEPTVAAVMSSPVITISDHATLSDALQLLTAARIRHLAVTGSGSRCRGVLADRVIAAAWADDPVNFAHRRLVDILPSLTPAVQVSASISTAARLMQRTGADAVIAVDAAGHVAGIVTAADLIGALAATAGSERV